MSNDLWTGSGNWVSNPADWSLGVPTSSETAEIQTGSVTLTAVTTVAAVQIDYNTGLYVGLPGSLTVTGGLTNNGTFDVGTNDNDGAGDTVTIGGTLANNGYLNIGNVLDSAPMAVIAAALTNTASAELQLFGSPAFGTTAQAILDIAGSASTVLTQNINIYGDALLEFGSGAVQTIAGGTALLLDGETAQFDISGVHGNNTALDDLGTNAGILDFEGNWNAGIGGVYLTTSVGLTNVDALNVDDAGGAGGSDVILGGALYNLGAIVVGNSTLGPTDLVSATSLVGAGNVTVQGNETPYTDNQATLSITGAAPGALTGNLTLEGDAELEFNSGGIDTVGPGVTLLMEGIEAQITIAGEAPNSGLDSLAYNLGTLAFEGDKTAGPGGVSVSTGVSFTNTGHFDVDNDAGAGGSTVSIGGAFNNYGATTIGNTSLAVSTNVSATGYANSGALIITGSDTFGTQDQATLDIEANAPAVLAGSVSLYGDALLEFTDSGETKDNGFTSIGYGASLLLDGGGARIAIGPDVYNSAFLNLSLNNGALDIEGNWSNGEPGGVHPLFSDVNYANVGATYVDWQNGAGESDDNIGGTLNNSGLLNGATATLYIGNRNLSSDTSVYADSLSTTGNINLYGNTALGSQNQALLDITEGAAPTSVNGAWVVLGNAVMLFASGGITTIDKGSSLELDGVARISDYPYETDPNSALSGLSANYGTMTLRGNSSNGAGAVYIATTAALISLNLYIDSSGGDGGTTLTLGAGLTNTDDLYIGNQTQSASTMVTATALTNDGSLILQGDAVSGGANQTLLDITGTPPTTLTGYIYVRGDAELEFKGSSVGAVGFGSILEIDGLQATVANAGGTANSALVNLSTVAGQLTLRGNSSYGFGGVALTTSIGMNVTGQLDVDQSAGDGGSSVMIGGALTDRGLIMIGNTRPNAATLVNATVLANFGTLDIYGNSSFSAELTIGGASNSYGVLNIAASAELATVGAFTQWAGATTIAGVLTASAINADGGLIDFSTTMASTGTLNIYSGGTMEFDGSDAATVNFKATTGTLELSAPLAFTATIAGFAGNDVVDLLDASVTGLTYNAGVLTVTGASGTIAHLAFSGSYSQASFASVSDGHGGSDILLTPVSQWNGSSADWTVNADWTTPPTSTTHAVLAAPGGYNVTVTTAISVGSVDIIDTSAALYVEAPSLTATVQTNLINGGGLYIDTGNDQGGSALKIGGALVNTNAMTLGNSFLDASTTVTAALLYNSGNLNLWGNETPDTTEQATLDITGAAPTVLTGSLFIHGDSLVEFGSGVGFTTIAAGAELQLDGMQSRLSVGAGTTNSALSSLATNAGTLDFEGNWITGPGGSSVTTNVGLANSGTLDLDVYNNDGASVLTIGGTLANSHAVTIGNATLSANTTLTATGLSNNGAITLWGSKLVGTTNQAALHITAGAAPTTLTGDWFLHGDALVEFASGGVTTIAFGSELQLDGQYARMASNGTVGNTALAGLTTNAGTLDLEGNSTTGPGGSMVTTTVGLTNVGTFELDVYPADGGSTFNIGGFLNNSGALTIGNNTLSAVTTLSAKGFANNGTVTLWGNETASTTKQAILNISGAASAALTGNLYLHGDALVAFASGGVTTVAAGVELQLDGAQSVVESGGVAGNSALTKLSNISGTFDIEGDSNTGPGGSVVTTTVGLTNHGNLDLDVYGHEGASSLTIGGTFVNAGAFDIGNDDLSDDSFVSASALINEGSILLLGATSSGATDQASLRISGAASGALTGKFVVTGDAALDFASGSYGSIAAGAYLELDGAQALVSDGDGANSALNHLSAVAGRLVLRGNSGYGGTVTLSTAVAMFVTGEMDVDTNFGDGGSKVTIGGNLVDTGILNFGGTASSAATTIAATALVNYGTLSLAGSSPNPTTMTISSGAANYGTVSIGANTILSATGGAYTQYSGNTSVAGILEGTINDEGGLIDFTAPLISGDGTGALKIYAGATMEFGGSVDSSHTVTFESGTGDLELGAAAGFAATLSGFTGNDIIDLLNATATSLSYSGHTLTIENGANVIAQLAFSGSYTSASFGFVSDGHGGTDILDPLILAHSGH